MVLKDAFELCLNHFDMKLNWDETDKDKWITVTFAYSPKYLFDMMVDTD